MLNFQKTASIILVLVMLFNLMPMQALGSTSAETITSVSTSDETLSTDTAAATEAASATIVEEIEASRTEYSKEFRLSNGLNMAVVYGEPVHYDNNGTWAEIDNTLKSSSNGVFTNTAGVWDVSLPQQLTATSTLFQLKVYTFIIG